MRNWLHYLVRLSGAFIICELYHYWVRSKIGYNMVDVGTAPKFNSLTNLERKHAFDITRSMNSHPIDLAKHRKLELPDAILWWCSSHLTLTCLIQNHNTGKLFNSRRTSNFSQSRGTHFITQFTYPRGIVFGEPCHYWVRSKIRHNTCLNLMGAVILNVVREIAMRSVLYHALSGDIQALHRFFIFYTF